MSFKFDHLVHFVNELEPIINDFQGKGFHLVKGGRHEKRGTHNVLLYTGLSYIEFLSTYDRDLVMNTTQYPHSLIDTIVNSGFEEGFHRFAVRTENIEQEAARLNALGYEVNGPVDLHRQRPDGTTTKWQLLYAGKDGEQLPLPFIIQWQESDEERLKILTENGTLQHHKNGAIIDHIVLAVNDLETTIASWEEILQVKASAITLDKELVAYVANIELPGGVLKFASPAGVGEIQSVLNQKGESIVKIVFNGHNESQFVLSNAIYEVV